MSRALHAEWTKLTAVRSTPWSLLIMLALTLILSALVTGQSTTDECEVTGNCDEDVIALSLGGVYFGQIAVATLGVMAVSSEFTSRMIRTTFTAMPHRRTVLAAKAAVVAAIVFVAGLVASVASFLLGLSLLAGNGFNAAVGYPLPSLIDGPALRAIGGTALYLTGLALLSVGIGAILRSTAAAISTVLALLWVPLIVISLIGLDDGLKLAKFSPMLAGLAIQATVERADSVPINPWAGLGVMFAYAAVALAAALWLVTRRDA